MRPSLHAIVWGGIRGAPTSLDDAESISEWYGWFPTLPTTYAATCTEMMLRKNTVFFVFIFFSSCNHTLNDPCRPTILQPHWAKLPQTNTVLPSNCVVYAVWMKLSRAAINQFESIRFLFHNSIHNSTSVHITVHTVLLALFRHIARQHTSECAGVRPRIPFLLQ